MRTLGALLAGGRSQRFGSDKAEAILEGRSLLDHAAEALGRVCKEFVIVGRDVPNIRSIADWPGPNMGPLGGLAGALRFADAHGFENVLSVPVDCVSLPQELLEILAPSPSCLAGQPVIGLWPVSGIPILEEILLGDHGRSMRTFANLLEARLVESGFDPPNINSRADLERMMRSLA